MEEGHRGFIITQSLLRILGLAATLTAITFLVTSNQAFDFLGINLYAKYNYSPAFIFFLGTNITTAVLSALSFFLLCVNPSNSANPTRYLLLSLIDFISTVIGVSGTSAASAIGYLGKYGNTHSNWMPICDYFGFFCKRVTISLILACLSNFLSLVLSVWSSFKITRC